MTRLPFMTEERPRSRPGRRDYREVGPNDTLPKVLRDEMQLRGHNQADAARAMMTAGDRFEAVEANLSRWLSDTPVVPSPAVARSQKNIRRLMRYLRIRTTSEYAALAFNTMEAAAVRRRRR